jgi:L-cysteine/cystine lyase
VLDIARIRADLPSAATNAYLNAGTFGPLARPAADAMRAYIEDAYIWGRTGARGYAAWKALGDAARAAFAGVVDADPGEIALTHSTTDGVNVVLGGLDWEAGDEAVTTTHEHPGLTAPLDELARRRGVVVRMAEPTRAAIADALCERTRVVGISHVLWTTGDTLPLAGIVADAAAVGALVLVDGAQAGGAVPCDPRAEGVDFYTLSGQKWLCGPSGTGALWVRPERLALLATSAPWYLSKDRRSGPEPREWPTARRLDAGTVSLGALAGAAAAIGWRQEIGWDASFARAAGLAAQLRDLLADVPGLELATAAAPSTIVSYRVSGHEPADLVAAAEAAGVLIRPLAEAGLVRASVGFWNDERDLERLAAVAAG